MQQKLLLMQFKKDLILILIQHKMFILFLDLKDVEPIYQAKLQNHKSIVKKSGCLPKNIQDTLFLARLG
jgi:hypothetical protein